MTSLMFVKLVDQMRVEQRKWFKGDKSTATLQKAKTLERAVDRAVAQMLDPQPSLLPEDDE